MKAASRTLRTHRQHILAGSIIAVVALFGVLLIVRSQAETPSFSLESEDGTTTAPANHISDATASGGQATAFRTAAAAPLWSEEFDGPAGSLVNPAKWGYEVGYIRNNELQYYTGNDADNVSLDGAGHVKITLRKEAMGGKAYTSGSINTKGKYTFQYGYLEARLQTPSGSGIWPAFWTLANCCWPGTGEIDVMEQINTEAKTYFTIHAGPTHWGNGVPVAMVRDGAWHTYAARVTPGKVEFYLDGRLSHTVTKANVPAGGTWPFDTNPQYILLNVAMGGVWPGTPNGSAVLPASMTVDYVRVYPSNY
ncbi:MAG TPA: glycoside hydrolase family 16 protein [Candidatus Saccharimonadales bacterium]